MFEDWYSELNLLSITAQITTNSSAPPLDILTKVLFLRELYSWSWAYSYTKLEAPPNSSHLATKWPRREGKGGAEPAPEPGSLGGWCLFCAWGCHLMWWFMSQKVIRGRHAEKNDFLALIQGKGLVKGEIRWEDWRLMNRMSRVPPWTWNMEEVIFLLTRRLSSSHFYHNSVCCPAVLQWEFLDRNRGLLYEIREEPFPNLIADIIWVSCAQDC